MTPRKVLARPDGPDPPGDLLAGPNLRTSINLTTDRDFLDDYGIKSGDYNRQQNATVIRC